MPGKPLPALDARLPYVNEVRKSDGSVFLYYRRDGRRWPLPGPVGSSAFLAAYDRAAAAFEAGAASAIPKVADAIRWYRGSPEYLGLALKTRRSSYDGPLAKLEERLGAVPIADVTPATAAQLRRLLGEAGEGRRWNRLRSLGKLVWAAWNSVGAPGQQSPAVCPWTGSKALKVPDSEQNRAWPSAVFSAALAAATPEFRALLLTLLLTGQRIGDVCSLRESAWDSKLKTLTLTQEKTLSPLVLGVPPALADAFAQTVGRAPGRLLCTPRARAWTVANAEETWLRLREHLRIERYTLHGLRATGVTALASSGGWDARALMALTGHTTERNLNIYLRGAARAPEAARAAEAVAAIFLLDVPIVMNDRKFSGVTGRAAAKARVAKNGDN